MSIDTLGLSLAADSGAVSQYKGIHFTSFLRVGGQLYGTTPGGLFLVGGDDDAGAPIRPVIEGPATDAGSDHFKRLRAATIAGPRLGNLALSARFDGGEWRESLPLGGGRFAFGRDGAGRAVQFRIEGEGPDFEITRVTLECMALGKRGRG